MQQIQFWQCFLPSYKNAMTLTHKSSGLQPSTGQITQVQQFAVYPHNFLDEVL